MTEWAETYTCTGRVYRIDPATWTESEYIGNLRSCHIERSDAALVESASMECEGQLDVGYYGIYADVEQSGPSERHALGTFLAMSDSGTIDKGFDTVSAKGLSVLYPAQARRMARGMTIPPGSDGADYVASGLSSILSAPVSCSGAFVLDEGYTFDIGTTYLDGYRVILAAGGWHIAIDGRGRVSVEPMPSEPSLVLDWAGASVLMPSVGHSSNISSAVNAYTAVDGMLTATAINDDPRSRTSIQSLGFRSDAQLDMSPLRINGETLAEYAARKLAELSVIIETRTYVREYDDDVRPGSIVLGSMQTVGLDGPMRVTKQAVDVVRGSRIKVSEEARMEVRTWPI